ncbi:penicillin-binding protein 2 [Patescibacteria group bacterium]|nr:penicillin-binding protein 2 [Patescibacteria group bacterium]
MKKRNKDPFVIPQQAKGMKNNLLPRFSHTQELGSFFMTEKPASLWLGNIISLVKFNISFLFIVLLFVILFFRLGFLQLIKGEEYRQLAEGNRIRLEYLLPQRGIIFDRWHQPLVENVSAFSLYLTPSDLPSSAMENEKIRNLLKGLEIEGEKLSSATVDQLIDSKSQVPLLVKENLDYEEAVRLMIETSAYPSLRVVTDPRRHYLSLNQATAHLLGYTTRITSEKKDFYLDKGYQLIERVGTTGIEEFYQDQLRGKLGEKRVEVDSLGHEKKIIAEEKSVSGKNLILAIDKDLQEIIAETFKKNLSHQAAAAVALDPRSGKVRALVNWPTFDNNIFSQSLITEEYNKIISDPLKPLINRAIAGEYPSGSIIKMVVGGVALEEDLVTRSTQILSSGGVWYDKWFFPDWKEGGHGVTNIIKALAESVNTYFYYLALEDFDNHQGLGIDKMTHYFEEFGLGQVLGLDIHGEKTGLIPTPAWKKEVKEEIWYPGDTLHLAIGQGDLLVTPLQMANITAVIANGGVLYRPQIVEQIEDPLNNQKQNIKSEIINYGMVSKSNLKIIAEGMRAAVLGGSAKSLANHNLAIAGKTGTAQVGGNKKPHAWFTSFAPYDNPDLVLTIIVENGGEGSEVAVSIARQVWQWYADNRVKSES